MVTFPNNPFSIRYENMHLVRDSWPIQIKVQTAFLMMFGVYMKILFIIKVKIFALIKWSYRSLSQ